MDNLVIALLVLLLVAVVAGVLIATGRFKRDADAKRARAREESLTARPATPKHTAPVPADEAQERVVEEPERTPPHTPDTTYVAPTVEPRSVHDVTSAEPGTRNTDSGTA